MLEVWFILVMDDEIPEGEGTNGPHCMTCIFAQSLFDR